MSYCTMDFTESLDRIPLKPEEIDTVLAAWGKGEGMGEDAGHYRWAEDGATDWSGGFLLKMRDGRVAYITGWCDYTGWGCQDGADITFFADAPELSTLTGPTADEWDIEPADLNRWLSTNAANQHEPTTR